MKKEEKGLGRRERAGVWWWGERMGGERRGRARDWPAALGNKQWQLSCS